MGPTLLIIIRVVIVYFVLLLGIRLSGKREIGQMSPFDLVLLLLIASAVQNAMIGGDTSLTGGIVAALTLFLMNAFITRVVAKVPRLRNIVEGTPTLIIHNGKIIEENLLKEKLTHDTVSEALREHGVDDVSEVKVAVLEVDGSVSIIRTTKVSEVNKPARKIRQMQKK